MTDAVIRPAHDDSTAPVARGGLLNLHDLDHGELRHDRVSVTGRR
jgi:hypothetical protein